MPDVWDIPLVWVAALLLDRCLGEPRQWHPLVAFGRCANWLEARVNVGGWRILRGMVSLAVLLLPPVVLAWSLTELPHTLRLAGDIALLYLAIGWRSMGEHVDLVQQAIQRGDLLAARRAGGNLVSRDLEQAGEKEIATAMLETSLENSADALFASLFWYAVAGGVGVVLHRLANTLDAMWGYRNLRFEQFGKAAARLDDVLALLPSQLLALSFALVGGGRSSLRSWWQQGWAWKSVNAGSVMSSGAAALGLQLGGMACYAGVVTPRPPLGCGRRAVLADVPAVFGLVRRCLGLWFGAVLLLGVLSG